MPVCIVNLVSLSVPLPQFLSTLSSSSLKPLVISKVIRWIITPEILSVPSLLHPPSPYDLLIITEGPAHLPDNLKSLLSTHWSLTTGVPSRLTKDFTTRNASILHPPPNTIPPLTGSLTNPRLATSTQGLEFTPELSAWITTFSQPGSPGSSAVSMLNLLAFHPNQRSEYLKYGAAFSSSIGARRGGNAKIVGNVIDQDQGWDEIALAHYPSIMHFADMLASEDYQEVNHRHRIPSLRDTCILCTSEIALEDEIRAAGQKAKL